MQVLRSRRIVVPNASGILAARIRPVPLALVAAAFAITTLGEQLHWGGKANVRWWADTDWTLAGLLACIACLVTARRSHGRERLVWILFAFGTSSWFLGQVAWDGFEIVWGSIPPSPNAADVGYLGLALAFSLGVVFMGAHSMLSRLLLALDVGVIGIALSIFFTTIFWPQVLGSTEAYSERVTYLLYPTMYVTMLCAVLLILVRGAWRNSSVCLLVLGLLGQVVPFVLWSPLLLNGTFAEGSLLDAMWTAGQLLLAASAVCFKGFPEVESDSQVSGPVAFLSLDVAVGAVLMRMWDLGRTHMGSQTQQILSALVACIVIFTAFRYGLTLRRMRLLFTQARASAAALKKSEERFRAIFHSAPIGIEIADNQGRLTDTNIALQRMLGYTGDELAGMEFTQITHPEDVPAENALDDELLAGERDSYQLEKRHIRIDGEPLWTRLTATLVKDEAGEGQFAVGMVEDISERKRAEEALMHQAMHDALTELPNRALLRDRLEHALLSAYRDTSSCALLLMDLDRFKEVNDTFGHHYGDVLLQQIAGRLSENLRGSDTVARLGGDEFAVVLPDVDETEALQVAGKIAHALTPPVNVFGQSLPIDVSIGIAVYPDHGEDATTLLRQADIAMYLAKRSGTQVALYEQGQDQQTQRRITLVGALRQAIENEQLLLHYQPKVHCQSGAPAGVEALVRWRHPVHGLVPPDEFIPLAEHTGLIKPLTQWVLNEALRQVGVWRADGLEVRVAVNLSARTLHDQELPAMIGGLLNAWDASPSWLGIEITESAVMADADRALEVLQRLDAMGISISIDDFGTGYSSLAYLKRLPVTEIKIDRSFVMGMVDDGNNRSIVRATIGLAHDLDLKVVAEGVEDLDSWRLLAALGCDLGQGYYMSRPLPALDITLWLRERRRRMSLAG